jgi:hypothetical protein
MLSEKPAAPIFRFKDTQHICMKKEMHAQFLLVAHKGKDHDGRHIHTWESDIKIKLKYYIDACEFFLALSLQARIESVSLK